MATFMVIIEGEPSPKLFAEKMTFDPAYAAFITACGTQPMGAIVALVVDNECIARVIVSERPESSAARVLADRARRADYISRGC
jgi:hypothetical protein